MFTCLKIQPTINAFDFVKVYQCVLSVVLKLVTALLEYINLVSAN